MCYPKNNPIAYGIKYNNEKCCNTKNKNFDDLGVRKLCHSENVFAKKRKRCYLFYRSTFSSSAGGDGGGRLEQVRKTWG